jgi:alpha-glucoside transport system substrate-binding protein
MVYGADFSAGAITNETNAELGVDAKFFDFPSINGSPISVVGAGDVAVALVDNEANMALMRFLATPEAAEIWAAQGGFTSPNKGVDPAVYNSDILRESAKTLQNAEWFRFDLSDLQPSEFGSTAGTGMRFWFQEFLRNPDVERTAEGLEEDAQEAF